MEVGPSLPFDESCRTSYRLRRIPSFWFASTILVAQRDDGWHVEGKLTAALGEPPPGALTAECSRALSPSEAARLEQLIDRLQFFEMPAEDDRQGLDGEMWVLHGMEHQRYHAIARWSPEEPALVEFGAYLATLSGLSVERSRRPLTPKELQARERAREEQERQRAEEERRRAEAIARSNETVRNLVAELLMSGLTCPHCRVRTRDIRFVRGRSDAKSYLICRLCGRSFGPD